MNAQTGQQDSGDMQGNDGRMSFDEACAYAAQRNAAAFAVHPVFEEDDDSAPSGARVFVLAPDGRGGCFLRFVSGRFFANAYAADDVLSAESIPERVKELRFLPTRYEESWFTDQVQILIGKLMGASGLEAPHMPKYDANIMRRADAGVTFPVSFIGGAKKH